MKKPLQEFPVVMTTYVLVIVSYNWLTFVQKNCWPINLLIKKTFWLQRILVCTHGLIILYNNLHIPDVLGLLIAEAVQPPRSFYSGNTTPLSHCEPKGHN